jgi:Ni,Fe-hydrogenase I cytochrome b subunit
MCAGDHFLLFEEAKIMYLIIDAEPDVHRTTNHLYRNAFFLLILLQIIMIAA